MELFIVIPCYNEPDLTSSLNSLSSCHKPNSTVTVIVVVNSSLGASQDVVTQNELSLRAVEEWKKTKPVWIEVVCLDITNVPLKIAGVGNARKCGMDKAYDLALNKNESVILCYDADCTCSPNYLTSIVSAFESHPKHDLATIYFEHRFADNQAIVDYELFLRYHYQGLKFAQYPYAYQTIGSSMAVRAHTYKAFGGMNKRKAGEDFYFLHKIIPYRKVLEINTCVVIPSSRKSDRVPFGTGHAVAKFDASVCKTYYTYNPIIYQHIGMLIQAILTSNLTHVPLEKQSAEILHFLEVEEFREASSKIQQQSKSDALYHQNLFRWLNGFRMLKLVHHLRDTAHTNICINDAVTQFWHIRYGDKHQMTNAAWLEEFRKLERQSIV